MARTTVLRQPKLFKRGYLLLLSVLAILILTRWLVTSESRFWPRTESGKIAPLVMTGGNPYVRALMRTISASEASGSSPYALLYGGEQVEDLSQHPDRCVPIVAGPNQGDCTTAAGRYQFLTTTWLEKAQLYHPQPSGLWIWTSYSFEPEYQDRVVYAWLKDVEAWGEDIPALLKSGQIDRVLWLLSGTWTSLGYGIEDNDVTPYLEQIYQQMLKEELAQEHLD